ncbi:MAG: FlgO family outer membrane protein [Pseudomonadota bacterium]
MKSLLIAPLTVLLVISGCTVLPKPADPSKLSKQQQPYSSPESSRYAAEIAEQLAAQATTSTTDMVVGVTTLSGVTSDYSEGTPFAQTLTQQLMTELHRQQVPLMDFKTTDFIRVTDNGDFALTRDYLEIDEILPITHVVVGTMAQHRQGVMVSARLVDINSKDVVSVAQTFIPEMVVRQLNEQGEEAIIRKAP